MKKSEITNFVNKFVAICDPHVYKNIAPETARKAKVLGEPESDGKTLRVPVEFEDKSRHQVTLAEIRVGWTEHEAKSKEFAAAAKARSAKEAADLTAREKRAKSLVDALKKANVECRSSSDSRQVILTLDQADALMEVLFPKPQETKSKGKARKAKSSPKAQEPEVKVETQIPAAA